MYLFIIKINVKYLGHCSLQFVVFELKVHSLELSLFFFWPWTWLPSSCNGLGLSIQFNSIQIQLKKLFVTEGQLMTHRAVEQETQWRKVQ